ncbi:MAG: SCO family protein [Denitrovibrio sp.]|nr:MAG: SCO family protein [Denitrovibrio sp.]
MKTKIKIIPFLLLTIFFCLPLYAADTMDDSHHMEKKEMSHDSHDDMDMKADEHAEHDMENMDMDDKEHVHKEASKEEEAKIGVTEKLGEQVDLNAVFTDSKGNKVNLGQLVDKPTIFAPVYYSCPNVCNFLQTSLADVVPQIKLKAGEDFQVISVSFDENDTPEIAAQKKINYMKAAEGQIPEDAWIFLSGDRENILKFTKSVGFRFLRRGVDFAHPVVVVTVSPSGKIVRYLYGTETLPFELTMASVEASKEQTGLSVKKLVSYCFSYDPQGKKYVFNVVKVSGFVVLTVILIFVGFLIFGGKKRK